MKLVFDTHGNEKQKQAARYWCDNETNEIVYGGSKGSGKSYLGCSLIFGDALMYPETAYFIARKELNDLRKYTMQSVYEVFNNWGLSNQYYSYDGKDNFWKLYNGSKVYFLEAKFLPSDPEYSRFGSIQMTKGMIEEAGEIDEAAKGALMATCGRWKNTEYGLKAKLLQTCNPAKNYLYHKAYKPNKEKRLPSHIKFIQALPNDNRMLPEGYVDLLLKTLTKNQIERLVHGNWEYDDDPTVLMDYDKITDVFSNVIEPIGEKCITIDAARFGGDRIVAIVWHGWRGKIYSWKKQGLDKTAEMIEKLRAEFGIGKSSVLVDEDGLGGGLVDFGKYRGFTNNAKPIQYGKDTANYDNLKSQCYFGLSDIVNTNKIHLTADSSEIEQLIIEELEVIKQRQVDTDMKRGVIKKEVMKELLGRSPDFADAIMMRKYFDLVPKISSNAVLY